MTQPIFQARPHWQAYAGWLVSGPGLTAKSGKTPVALENIQGVGAEIVNRFKVRGLQKAGEFLGTTESKEGIATLADATGASPKRIGKWREAAILLQKE